MDIATGRQQRGSLVAGFLHSAVRVRGENIECVQVRLSPLIARTVLGASPSELDRTVVALDDLWGQDAVRVAADSGYVDQSHLHRDVLAFTAVTPATVADQPWLAVDGIAWAGHNASDGAGCLPGV